MAGKIYNVFLGGDKFKRPEDNWMDNNLSDFRKHLEYAGHLKRAHWVVPFVFDRFAPNTWESWFRESGLTDLEPGDSFGANLVAAGSFMNNLVFHNKKALPGTKLVLKLLGNTGDEPANVAALTEAIKTAKDAYDKAVTAVNASPEDEALKKAMTKAKKALDEAEDKLQKVSDDVVAEHEVDLSLAGFFRFPVGKLFQSNGMLYVELKEGTLMNACFTALFDVEYFDDEHGCHCGQLPCDTPYPDAECQPQYSVLGLR